MNQTQKNYTLKRIQEIGSRKIALLTEQSRKDVAEARGKVQPKAWPSLTDDQKVALVNKEIKAKRMKVPTVALLFKHADTGNYQNEHLKKIFPGLTKLIDGVNKENSDTEKAAKEAEARIVKITSRRRESIEANIVSLSDQIMLGENAEACLEAIAEFEKKTF
jgi:hypothetical protein